MKKMILIFLLGVFFYPTFSQYNTELIDTTKIWSTVDTYTAGGGIMHSFYNKFGGDTVINSTTYTKVYRAYDEFMDEWELQGFVRQEDNSFYFRNLIDEEGLAYDFDVSVGEILFIDNPFAFYSFEAEVTEVDSVYIEPANEYRKRIKLHGWSSIEESWIEGMGSDAGIVMSGCKMGQLTGGGLYSLLCYFEDEELMFKSDSHPLCFYPIVDISVNDIEETDYLISPNPVIDISHLIIRNPESKNLNVKFFNSFGQLIDQYNSDTSFELEIRSADFSKGVYFYSIFEDNTFLTSDKFIIR